MKENNDITGLFRSKLADAQMEVRDGFWAELEHDLVMPAQNAKPVRKYFWLRRFSAAASVVLVLGAASAAFWYLSPREELKDAFRQIAVLAPEGSLNGDLVQEKFPSIYQAIPPSSTNNNSAHLLGKLPVEDAAGEDGQVSVRVSITITQQMHAKRRGNNGFYASAGMGNVYQGRSANTDESCVKEEPAKEEDSALLATKSVEEKRKWAFKAAMGTSLPKGNYRMPLTAAIDAEYGLNRYLSFETGLQYNRLAGEETLHTLSVPLRLNVMLATSPKIDLYAMAGGSVEKCIAGASDNGFDAEPIQLSAMAGLGMRYKLNDRFALFAEPSVSYHFDTSSQTQTLRTEKPLNLNLLCGVRMTY